MSDFREGYRVAAQEIVCLREEVDVMVDMLGAALHMTPEQVGDAIADELQRRRDGLVAQARP